jgi:PTH1 family peptidyl-tRNA hydrolase
MFLLAGLGNIGNEYQNTRHNFGFILIDQIIKDYNFNKLASKKSLSEIYIGEINGQKIIAIKPKTYMNLSGGAVLEMLSFYKIPLQNIIVFHDDLDLALGKIRLKIGGSSAGHNGLNDIDQKIGKDYLRLRLGIGRPENKNIDIADYVLSKFLESELKIVEQINKRISALMPQLIMSKLTSINCDNFMNKFSLNQ